MLKKFFSDWKVHLLCIAFVVVAEWIGIRPFSFLGGKITFSLLPMLYVLVFGIVLSLFKAIPRETMQTASPYIGIATMWLIAKLSTSIGPNLDAIIKAGPALILQEFGNLGTIFFSVPIAIFVFKMGRQAVGAGFSNSREGSLALVGSMYGLDSPEGQGVMGAYVTGTILGTLFCGLLASFAVSTKLFHPYALAMAAGTGSASMMAAGMGPVVEAYPEMNEQIQAFASTSNLLSTVDGLYMSLFLGIPLTNWLYKVLKGEERYLKAQQKRREKKAKTSLVKSEPETSAKAKAPLTTTELWTMRLKVLVLSGFFALIANWLSTRKAEVPVTALDGALAILLLLIPVILGCIVDDLVRIKWPQTSLPAILWISIIAIIMGLPNFPGNELFIREAGKIGVLPLCTPILAYAGVSIGKDLKSFKQQGIGIICTALMAFIGTYIGSAIIAQIVLSVTNVI
ncbi:MAG: DUF3100 domain-containing protein [Lachnospiraceae bacterium]